MGTEKARLRAMELENKSAFRELEAHGNEASHKEASKKKADNLQISWEKSAKIKEKALWKYRRGNLTALLENATAYLRHLQEQILVKKDEFKKVQRQRKQILLSPAMTPLGAEPSVDKNRCPLKWIDDYDYHQKQGAFIRVSTANLLPGDQITSAALHFYKEKGSYGEVEVHLASCAYSPHILTGLNHENFTQNRVSLIPPVRVSRLGHMWEHIPLQSTLIQGAFEAGKDLCFQLNGGPRYRALPAIMVSTAVPHRPYVKVLVTRAEALAKEAEKEKLVMTRAPPGHFCENAKKSEVVLRAFRVKGGSNNDLDCEEALEKCEDWCKASKPCQYCSVVEITDSDPPGFWKLQWVALSHCGQHQQWAGRLQGDISFKEGNSTQTSMPDLSNTTEALDSHVENALALAEQATVAAQQALEAAEASGDPVRLAQAQAQQSAAAAVAVAGQVPPGPMATPVAQTNAVAAQRAALQQALNSSASAASAKFLMDRMDAKIKQRIAEEVPEAIALRVAEDFPSALQAKKQESGLVWGAKLAALKARVKQELAAKVSKNVTMEVQEEIREEEMAALQQEVEQQKAAHDALLAREMPGTFGSQPTIVSTKNLMSSNRVLQLGDDSFIDDALRKSQRQTTMQRRLVLAKTT